MQNNKKKLPNVVILMILTLITVLFWISFSIYNVFQSSPAPVVSNDIIQQLNPQLDTSTIDVIKGKI